MLETKADGIGTGHLIAAQIKSGDSYFARGTENGWWLSVEDKHHDLWLNHSLPVIVILCNLAEGKCFYQLINDETFSAAGENWKILVPAANAFDETAYTDLVNISSPVAAVTEYTIFKEDDVSRPGARHISINAVVNQSHKPLSKAKISAIVHSILNKGKGSSYYRDNLLKTVLQGRAVDVVFGFIYLREIDRESASWICKFEWVSDSLESTFRPSSRHAEPHGDGLTIEWQKNPELADYFDSIRVTKSEFLNGVDEILNVLPAIEERVDGILAGIVDAPDFSDVCSAFESQRYKRSSCPQECHRLNQAICELEAIVGNIGLWWSWRDIKEQRVIFAEIRKCANGLSDIKADIAFLRREVR